MRFNITGKILFLLSLLFSGSASAQLTLGTANSEINFREGPGVNFKVMQKVNSSNLLVVLPGEPQNGFVEAFDVETSSRGYVSQSLIQITDTLRFGKQNFFEKSGETTNGSVEIEIINGTSKNLFFWINKFSYDIVPHEKKTLILDEEEMMYFASAPGMFPVFGKEVLQKGNSYKLMFSK